MSSSREESPDWLRSFQVLEESSFSQYLSPCVMGSIPFRIL
jgi:hypothetical protein